MAESAKIWGGGSTPTNQPESKIWGESSSSTVQSKPKKKKKTESKHRYFTFLMYLDSSPDDRVDILESLGQPIAISPLHDSDVREIKRDDMTPDERKIVDSGGKLYKKPHYHVIYVASNPVTAESVRKKLKRRLGDKAIALIQIVDNVKGCFDYLTHDSKDAIKKKKHKYPKSKIILLNNFDIARYEVHDENQKAEILDRITKAIFDNHIMNMHQLVDFLQLHPEYHVQGYAAINAVLASKAGLARLYMDGEYQEYRLKKEQETSRRYYDDE